MKERKKERKEGRRNIGRKEGSRKKEDEKKRNYYQRPYKTVFAIIHRNTLSELGNCTDGLAASRRQKDNGPINLDTQRDNCTSFHFADCVGKTANYHDYRLSPGRCHDVLVS